MQKKLCDTSASNDMALGLPPQQRLFRIDSGPHTGRLVTAVATTSSTIELRYADPPYTAWSTPLSVATDAADGSFDCALDSSGDLHVVYTEATTFNLVTRRLLFDQGQWSVGSKVTIFTGAPSYDPSLAIDADHRLWVSFSLFTAPNRVIHVKSSSDSGATWGTSPADTGFALTTPAQILASKLLCTARTIHVIYAKAGESIAFRSLPGISGSWSDEFIIASDSTGFDKNFDAAVSPDGLLAVVFNDSQLRYREFDTLAWSPITTLDSLPQDSPQILFRRRVPVILFLAPWNGLQKRLKYIDRKTGSFSTPRTLDSRSRPFDTVLLYDQTSATYADLTVAAQSDTTGDLIHPASGCLVKNSGDAIYLGLDRQFRYAQFLLSRIGSGGSITSSYWDGIHWNSFSPSLGTISLTAGVVRSALWSDYQNAPPDWQEKSIAGITRFWIKLEVVTPFSTGPIGSQITAISELTRVVARKS